MAKSKKYKFKKEFSDARIVIPGRDEITKESLTDEDGDLIMKSYPQLAHNIELIGGEEEEEKPKSKKSDKNVNEGENV
jgi:hypothetical protein